MSFYKFHFITCWVSFVLFCFYCLDVDSLLGLNGNGQQ